MRISNDYNSNTDISNFWNTQIITLYRKRKWKKRMITSLISLKKVGSKETYGG